MFSKYLILYCFGSYVLVKKLYLLYGIQDFVQQLQQGLCCSRYQSSGYAVRYLLMFQDISISADGAGGDHQGRDQGGGARGGRGGAPPQEQPAQAAVPPVPAAGDPHCRGAGTRTPLRHQQ